MIPKYLSAVAGLFLLGVAALACAPAQPASPHLTVVGPWSGAEREAFLSVVDVFTAQTKIPVQYESIHDEMGAILRTRLAAGDPPNIALNPRPGEVAEFARSGNLVDLGTFISNDELTRAFGQTFINLGKVDGKQVGIFFKANSKSTFWYKPASFKQLSVEPPQTLNDLFAIAEKYKGSGKVPFAAGGKDGWVLTDYQENLFARMVDSRTYYDLYVTHKVPWTDDRVKQSLALFARFFETGNEPGGGPGVLSTTFTDSVAQVFSPDARAEMIFEGGFVGVIATMDVNRSLKPGEDIDFFTFPQVDPQYGTPVVGGGDTAIMFKDTPEARAFMRFLISKEAADVLASANTISPNLQLDPNKFPSPLARKEYQQLATAATFVFDGSDLAPSALGGDYLFGALRKIIQNPTEIDKVAQDLENFARSAY